MRTPGLTDEESPPSPPPASRKRQVAVALQYELGGPSLPRVSASGKGVIAEQIVALAFASGVKVREDADLAELLSAVELDCEIPPEALIAVAEILSYVYRENGRLPQRARRS
jgi:flagellar biosynthesis protein